MPAYNASTPIALVPGDAPVSLYSGETVATGNTSQQVTRGYETAGSASPITFALSFASAPTASVFIQGAMTDTAGSYVNISSSITAQAASYRDVGSWRFYRVSIASYSAGGLLTVVCGK